MTLQQQEAEKEDEVILMSVNDIGVLFQRASVRRLSRITQVGGTTFCGMS